MAIKLNRHKKYLIYAASGVVCLFVVINFIISPFLDKKQRSIKAFQVKMEILGNMIDLRSEYEVIKNNAGLSKTRFAKRKKDFTLFSFLDQLAGKAEIKDYITYMKPSTSVGKDNRPSLSIVEMKLHDITLKQLTKYLYMVETSKNIVFVKKLSISKTSKKEFIDAVLRVETFSDI